MYKLKQKIYLITEIIAYSDDTLRVQKFAFTEKKKASRKFLELRSKQIGELLDYYDENSYTDLLDNNHIDETENNSTFFGYTNKDGTVEYELEMEHIDVY